MSDIPFESFCGLLSKLSKPPIDKTSVPRNTSKTPIYHSPEKLFISWLNDHSKTKKGFVSGTAKHLFRLLFPHEGSRRRYGLKETTLAKELGKALCVDGLERWDSVRWEGAGGAGTGCLGQEVEAVMKSRMSEHTRSSMTIREVDSLLDALASQSPFSQLSQQPSSTLTTSEILIKLYRDSSFSASALSVLTQIILRDLRPILDPLTKFQTRNPTAMLAIPSTAGPKQLELLQAMRAWDGKMAELYRGGKGSIDWCADKVEQLGGGPGGQCRVDDNLSAGPIVGVNVTIPKCEKGRSVEAALNAFCANRYTGDASVVWAETKYDGYRMQIHVDIEDGEPVITVFSKSKRNSTIDRGNTHSIICASLGLPINPDLHQHPALVTRIPLDGPRLRKSVILEAEVIPYNEGNREGNRGPGIEEFWWLDAAGVVAANAPGFRSGPNRLRDTDRHLCLAFFDILHLNGTNLLVTPYKRRRELLEATVQPIHGFSILCERTPIPLHLGRPHALSLLQKAFDESKARAEEGLVLKSDESKYNAPSSHRWVKLKKDYIDGVGDCVDFALLGAGWDLDRARELRVDTSVFTTWYVGVLINGDKVRKRLEKPIFEAVNRVSYGPNREALSLWNAKIRHGEWGTKPYDKDDTRKSRAEGLSWTFLPAQGMPPPSVLFEQPMLAEVMGAGFQKLRATQLYEIRWPRLQKILDPREKTYIDAVEAPELIRTAHKSLGYLAANPHSSITSSPEDSISTMWRTASSGAIDIPADTPSPIKPGSPSHRSLAKRVKSAPDLGQIMKLSPPTPRHSRRSPLRLPISPISNRVLITSPCRRMIEAISGGKVDSPSSRGEAGRLKDRETDIGFGGYLMPTPITSPAKRPAGPISSFSPVKRLKAFQAVPSPPHKPERYTNLTGMARQLRTPPPSSPILSSVDTNVDVEKSQESLEKDAVLDKGGPLKEVMQLDDEVNQVPVLVSKEMNGKGMEKRSWKKGTSMSLRSRIRLALRNIGK